MRTRSPARSVVGEKRDDLKIAYMYCWIPIALFRGSTRASFFKIVYEIDTLNPHISAAACARVPERCISHRAKGEESVQRFCREVDAMFAVVYPSCLMCSLPFTFVNV